LAHLNFTPFSQGNKLFVLVYFSYSLQIEQVNYYELECFL
jgi:hypothetical protein